MGHHIVADCAIALKEWATVIEAMGRGEQLVLIRKGGLIEPGSGFELAAPSFVFYPTFEHQAVQYLRQPFQGYFDLAKAARASEGQVRFGLFGQAAHAALAHDPEVVKRLEPFHVYNDAFLTQRLKWQPDQPLMIVIVRAFRMAPKTILAAPQYAGCKSWVELDAPVALEQLVPVLDDAAFASRRREIESALGPC
ncbi:MAG: DUF1802 family protein [Candidatus Omnitrophica bacterium]|nr:DUF1802 family protein [Candidatus Omnitrophota bacterium]